MLSDADQQYVREELKAKGQEHLIPPAPESNSLTGDLGRELLDDSNDGEPGPERTWTDQRGRKIRARFVRFDGTRVVMLKDEKEVSVPLTQLSADDRRYAMEQHAGQQRRKAMERRLTSGGPRMPESPTASGGDHLIDPMGSAATGLDSGVTGPSGPTTTFPPTPSPPNIPSSASGWPRASSPPPMPAPPTLPAPPSFPSPTPRTFEHPAMSPPAVPVPTSPPSMPEFPGHSSRWMGEEGICSNCNKTVPANIGAGDHCPHCGVYFDYEEDKFGNRRNAPRKNSWTNSSGRVRVPVRLIAFVVVIVISGLGALFRAIRG
ncbi:MAG: hypothetical protein GX621_06710 [Pirellulaceae bacterium]|nr:hypothetical protein [Pirellulaceae bacterium]